LGDVIDVNYSRGRKGGAGKGTTTIITEAIELYSMGGRGW
jgi:hypothetical protein